MDCIVLRTDGKLNMFPCCFYYTFSAHSHHEMDNCHICYWEEGVPIWEGIKKRADCETKPNSNLSRLD